VNSRYNVLPRHGCRKVPQSKKVITVFIDFNYKNRNKKTEIFLHQNVAFVTSYEPINLTQTFYQYMSKMHMGYTQDIHSFVRCFVQMNLELCKETFMQ